MISVNNRNIQIREPGLLTRYEHVVLDELYNKVDDSLMGKLKGALSTPTISKEVHGNRTESDKNASVVATANIAPSVYNIARKKLKNDSFLQEVLYNEILALSEMKNYKLLKSKCEELMMNYPDYRMMEFVEDFYEDSLKELKKNKADR